MKKNVRKIAAGFAVGVRLVVGLVLGWATLGAILFKMPVSAVVGAGAVLVVVGWGALPVWPRRALAAASPFVAIVFVLQFAAPEYMRASDQIGCEVRAAYGEDRAFCRGHEPEVRLDRSGPVLSWSQANAVRWLNVSMALGGAATGFTEVAYETWLLQWNASSDRREEVTGQPLGARLSRCQQASGVDGATYTARSEIVLESARGRQAVARLARDLEPGGGVEGPLRWGNYASRDQTWGTTLALWVPSSRLRVDQRDGRLETSWSGDILYPATSQIAVTLPRPVGEPYRFALDEALFCAAQLDGVFEPYRMEWRASIDTDDARLSAPQVNENEPGWLEALVRPYSRELGLWHTVRSRPPAVSDEQRRK